MIEKEYSGNSNQLKSIWDANAQLGESPVWHEEEQVLYWVDILASTLHRYEPIEQVKSSWSYETAISAVAPCKNGGLIAAFADGIKFIDTQTGELTFVIDPEIDLADNRLNDGCCDSDGNFWFGSMDLQESKPSGSFYRLSTQQQCDKVLSDIVITNGPAFSPSSDTIYLTDTLERIIFSAKLAEDGAPTLIDLKEFARIPEEMGYPDGMTVDADGYLWVALFAGAKILRLDLNGSIVQTIDMPVPNITKCCFGGRDLQTLFITTAAKGLSEQDRINYPLAGNLFSLPMDVKGISSAPFNGGLST